MALDTSKPRSAPWWLDRLAKRLGDNQARYNKLDAYYKNVNEVPITAGKAAREAYQRLRQLSNTAYAELIVSALVERQQFVGFRTSVDNDGGGDDEAWRIISANGLDVGQSQLWRPKAALADAHIMVGPVDPEIGAPRITIEDPRQAITEDDPADRSRALAGLKLYFDDVFGVDRAFLHLPGWLFRFVRLNRGECVSDWSANGFEYDGHVRMPADRVFLTRFPNQVDGFGNSTGEFEKHIPHLDRINYGFLSRLEIATLQAFRQRALKGGPTRDEHGNEINYDDIFAADPGAFWHLPDGAEMWESGVVDLTPILSSIKDDAQALATVSSTPSYRFNPDAASGSAEGAALQREGLYFKATDRNREAVGPLKRVMSNAFVMAGDRARAQIAGMEVIFTPPEFTNSTARTLAAKQAIEAGVPWETVMSTVMQYQPGEIARMKRERMMDRFMEPTADGPAVPAR